MQSSVNGCLDFFHLLATILAMDVGVQLSVQVPVFSSFGYVPKSGITESYSTSNFLRNCRAVSILPFCQQCPRNPFFKKIFIYLFLEREEAGQKGREPLM